MVDNGIAFRISLQSNPSIFSFPGKFQALGFSLYTLGIVAKSFLWTVSQDSLITAAKMIDCRLERFLLHSTPSILHAISLTRHSSSDISKTDIALPKGCTTFTSFNCGLVSAIRLFQSSRSRSLLLKAWIIVKSLALEMRSTEFGTDPECGKTVSIIRRRVFPFSIAGTMFLRIWTASLSGQSCKIIRRR